MTGGNTNKIYSYFLDPVVGGPGGVSIRLDSETKTKRNLEEIKKITSNSRLKWELDAGELIEIIETLLEIIDEVEK